jgi:hypothetical protein
MAALVSRVTVRNFFTAAPAAANRVQLQLVWSRPLPAPRPTALWQRAEDGRLVCRWQPAPTRSALS